MLQIPPDFSERIRTLHGTQGAEWLDKLPVLVERYQRRWKLLLEGPFNGPSYNYVLRARRADGSPVVLKLGVPTRDLLNEIEALRLYDGRGCCRLLEAEPQDGALLLEQLVPGTMLVSLDDEHATRVAAQVMQQLWRPLPEAHPFPTTEQWASGILRLKATFDGGCGPFPCHLVDAAENLFVDLLASSHDPVLLHGDLHHYNILAAQEGCWLAIDPQGVVGEPLYETGALLRNPLPQVATWPELRAILDRRTRILAESLSADRSRIVGWGLAQAVLSSWWNYEGESYFDEATLRIAAALNDLHYER